MNYGVLDLEPTQVEGKRRIALNFNDLQAINELQNRNLIIACGNGLHMLDRKGQKTQYFMRKNRNYSIPAYSGLILGVKMGFSIFYRKLRRNDQ